MRDNAVPPIANRDTDKTTRITTVVLKLFSCELKIFMTLLFEKEPTELLILNVSPLAVAHADNLAVTILTPEISSLSDEDNPS